MASSDLWAVGQQGADKTLTEHWDGTSWSVVASPSTGVRDRLAGVAATGTAGVTAVGSYNTGSGTALIGRTLALHWNAPAGRHSPPRTSAPLTTPSGFWVDQTLILKGVSG